MYNIMKQTHEEPQDKRYETRNSDKKKYRDEMHNPTGKEEEVERPT